MWSDFACLYYFLTSLNKVPVLACQIFGPTTLQITFERNGVGRLTEEELSKIVVKDDQGSVVKLRLPKRSVLIANHQV